MNEKMDEYVRPPHRCCQIRPDQSWPNRRVNRPGLQRKAPHQHAP